MLRFFCPFSLNRGLNVRWRDRRVCGRLGKREHSISPSPSEPLMLRARGTGHILPCDIWGLLQRKPLEEGPALAARPNDDELSPS